MDEASLSPEDSEVIVNVLPQHNNLVCGDVGINKPVTHQLPKRTVQTYTRDIYLIIDNYATTLLFTILYFFFIIFTVYSLYSQKERLRLER